MGVTTGLVFLSLLGLATGSSCSDANRISNLDQCLLDIGGFGFNNTAFWFGTQYATNCPNGIFSNTLDCFNPLPQPGSESIFHRLFPDGYDPAHLDRFLDMEFISPAGTYEGCGNTFTKEFWTQKIDPLAGLVLKPWYTRNFPDLAWSSSPDEMFTLIAIDIGNLYWHGVYTNIIGNDTSTAEIIKAYSGPQRSSQKANPYIFLLFRQENTLNVSQDLRDRFQENSPGNITFSELMEHWNITGPVAMNWFVVIGDEYAAQRMLNFGVLNACPGFITESLMQRQRPFLPTQTSLSMSVNVEFTTTPAEFTACCSQHAYEQETFALNPLGNPVYDTYKTSQTPDVTFLKAGLLMTASDFTGELYTLLVVDPDVPVDTVGTEERPLLHWLVTNIENGNITTGDEYASYNGPAPPDRQPHYYYFLLYKQQAEVSVAVLSSYTGDCPARLATRCLFNVTELVEEQNLTFVGASWFTATTDIYVAHRKIVGGESMADWCVGMPGYGGDPDCPVGASIRTAGSVLLITILSLVYHFC